MSEPTNRPKTILLGGLKDPQLYTEPTEEPPEPLSDSSRKRRIQNLKKMVSVIYQ